MKLRQLIVEVATRWTGEAKLRAVKAVGDAASISLRGLSNTAEAMAVSLERSASRGAAAMRDLGAAAKAVGRVRESDAGASGSSRVRDEGLAAGRSANRQATRRRPAGGDDLDKAISSANKSSAMGAGLADGSAAIKSASNALGAFATKSDRAKAAVEDLTSKVERNRREMADLKAEAIKTGDADGTLAARMKGLSVATGQASVELGKARRELRALEGGLIATIKSASTGRITIQALGTAIGNLAANAASRVLHGITGGIADATAEAINFDKIIQADLSKVLKGSDDSAEGVARIEKGIKKASTELGVMPDQVAELAAALAPVFSGKVELDTGVAADLVALTSDVTKIGKAWEVSGAEAGQFFADISRGLDLTSTQTKTLFGSINELSNELGIKAATIAEAVQRSAGVLKASGLSPETGAALNATLIATGSTAEVAATGVRTFVSRLEAGRNASPKAREEFARLGLDAIKVGEEMSKGGKAAEAQLLKVVRALDELPKAEQLPALTGLFGSESIGSIGAAAGVEALAKSFGLASSEMANFASIEKEYARVSQTTAARVEKLKANIGVLAIEFGEALLPHIDKVVEFLTSPEGQEWGRGAVEKAVTAVTTLASAVGTAVSVFSTIVDVIGGTELAVGALALRVGALAGPWGLAAAAAVVAGAKIIEVIGKVIRDSEVLESVFTGLFDKIVDKQQEAWAKKVRDQGDKDDIDDKLNKPTVQYGYGSAPAGGAQPTAKQSAAQDAKADAARFAALSARRARGETLKPSEATEYTRLSKKLDEAKVGKSSGGSSWTDEQRRILAEERRLQGSLGGVLDPSKSGFADRLRAAGKYKENNIIAGIAKRNPHLANVLKQGRTKDKDGVLSGAGNELDKALEERSGPHLPSMNVGVSGPRGAGASVLPALSNTYNQHQTNTIHQQISVPPNSSPTLEGRLRAAGQTVAHDTLTGLAQAEIIFTGGSR